MIVTPHPDVQSGRFMQAEFAADLAQVHRGEGAEEYVDPREFFRRTFITSGLSDLLAGALARLGGKGGDPVLELQTNFGGGKTHSMLALYHLFGGTPSADLPGLEPVLAKAGIDRAVAARRAVLVGTALSPAEVITKPDGTRVRTLWGEMAWQLGKAEGFKLVADADAHSTSPGSNTLAELFDRFAPCLVLIDEWVAYARNTVAADGLPGGRFEAQASFAQALTEAAKRVPRALVVASVPASNVEIGGEHGGLALDQLKNVLERVGRPWRPASSDEGFEIVRRRLFEPITEKDAFAARDAVVEAFAKMYREAPAEFPPHCVEGAYRKRLYDAYPIHPELFSRLYEDWGALDKFQKTRGVLRLLAAVLHRLWVAQDAGLMVMPAFVPLDDSVVRSEVTRYLHDQWEAILDHDIDGERSLPFEIDGHNQNLGRFSACRRVTRTLYVGTAPGARGRNPGIDDRQVKLGCAQPGESAATFGDALRRISERARYVHQDGTRHWVSPTPNLNRLADDRASERKGDPELLIRTVLDVVATERGRGALGGVHVAPPGGSDVDDEPVARLVILAAASAHRKGVEDSDARRAAAAILDSGGRTNRNALVFLAPDKAQIEPLLDAAAKLLAWQSICDESRAGTLNLDTHQGAQAVQRRDDADRTLRLRIAATWIHLLVPWQKGPGAPVVWGEHKLGSGTGTLAERACAKLVEEDALFPELGALRLRMALDQHGLWSERAHIAFGELASWFAKFLYLPRVASRAVVRDGVLAAARELTVSDTFAVASGIDEATGRYRDLRQGGAAWYPVETGTLVVKPDVAAKQAPSVAPPPPPPPPEDPEKPHKGARRYVGSLRLDPIRASRDAGRVADEVIRHLTELRGARVTIRLEITMSSEEDVREDVRRVVSENARTLGFDTSDWDEGD